MHWIDHDFGQCHGRGIQRRSAPTDIYRQTREVDNTAIAAVAAQIMSRAHEDAIDRTWLDTQRTEHALRVIDREARDAEPFAAGNFFFADVDAIDRTSFRALIASDASR
jgi:hypothetical protein